MVNTQPLDPLDFLARLPWRKSLPISCLWSWPLVSLILVTGTRFLWPQMPSSLPEPRLSLMLGTVTGLPHMLSWGNGLWLTVSLLLKQPEGWGAVHSQNTSKALVAPATRRKNKTSETSLQAPLYSQLPGEELWGVLLQPGHCPCSSCC